jgi:hypothetical protein
MYQKLGIMGVFMIGVPKRNDLYFKVPTMDNFLKKNYTIIVSGLLYANM